MGRIALLATALFATLACAPLLPTPDSTTLSYGFHNRGTLVNAVRLPSVGDGYAIPPLWKNRGLSWGTEELVGLIVRASRRVDGEVPGSKLYVADLSPRHGGASRWHRSHQTGRDADLVFFALDEGGKPARPPAGMTKFGADGATPATRFTFDTARNWALVRALLEDPAVDVQYLFIYAPLEQLLLDWAVAHDEPAEIVERAAAVLHQPGDSLPHDDHLHVRIYCPANDRALGCRERGPLRWFKKGYKYVQARRHMAAIPEPLREYVGRPFCRFLAKTVIALR